MLEIQLPNQPIIFDNGTYIVPQGKRGTAVGSTSEKHWHDDGPDPQLDDVINRAQRIMPALKGARVAARWAGIRPRARLPDPAVGFLPGQNRICLMTGGFKIGLAIAPMLGDAVADLILEGRADLPESFRLDHQLSR